MNSKPETRNSPPPARVLIVDDHAIVRYGMAVLLSGAEDLILCGEAGTYDEAVKAIHDLRPDVAVIDIILHDRSGLDLIRQIRTEESSSQESGVRGQESEIRDQQSEIPNPHSPIGNSNSPIGNRQSEIENSSSIGNRQSAIENQKMPILVLSMHDEATHAEKALRAGAQGYIMKEDADEVLVEALRTVLSGKLHISGNISEKLLRNYVEDDEQTGKSGIESLTSREKEIFESMGKGLTTRKIAEQFDLSPRTVEVHRARIKKKLACEDAAQLLRSAVQWVESRSI